MVVVMGKNNPFRRCSFSIPRGTWEDLVYVSERMGITRSALVTEMLENSVSDMRTLLEMTPKKPTPADVKRLRGASVDFVKAEFQEVMEKLGHGVKYE